METVSMFFFRRKVTHQEKIDKLKREVSKEYGKAHKPIRKTREQLEENHIVIIINALKGDRNVR